MVKFFRFFVLFFIICTLVNAQTEKISSRVFQKLGNLENNNKVLVWVFFADKGNGIDKFFANPYLILSERSVERRAKLNSFSKGIDILDVPVNNLYINELTNLGIVIKQKSRWFNSVSCYVDAQQLSLLNKLNFVKNVDLVDKYKSTKKIESNSIESNLRYHVKGTHSFDYGDSYTQLQQINVPAVHDLGINGQGIIVGVLDAGFNNLPHQAFANMNIIAAYDFVNNDADVDDGSDMGDGTHGTETLSTIGGFKEGQLIGPAFGASFILAKTENTESETPIEEDNWIAGIEWMDSIGVDVTSTSLGYIDFDSPYTGYTWQSMNGNTCRITIAADLAVSRGICVVNSAGNEGDNSSHNTLGAPADGDSVIAVGAVSSTGSRVYFSSVGPTVDGRIKPDVMAMGSSVRVASPTNVSGYTYSDGTSFSGPLAGGVATLVLSAMPTLTPMQVRDAMRNTASLHDNPNNQYGYGILDALAAVNYFRVQISHSQLTDTENPNRVHKVIAQFSSEIPLLTNSLFLFYSTNDNKSYDSVAFSASGVSGFYEAVIPVNSNNTVVKYYLKASNSTNIASVLPLNAPVSTFQFKIGADTTPPVILHNALGAQSYFNWPPKLKADVTDNIAIKRVYVEYKLNHLTYQNFDLVKVENTNTYEAYFPFPQSSIAVGDVVDYRIVAEDSAAITNIIKTPATGYNTFSIQNIVFYSSNFDTEDGSLIGTNDWQWGTPSGTSPTPHSGTKLWGTKLSSNYSSGPLLSSLETPSMQVVDDNAKLDFWHWYSFESGYDGGNVKVSINGAPFTLITPVGGYSDVISTSYENPLGGQSAFASSSSTWVNCQFDLAGIVNQGDNVVFRFDFGSDSSIQEVGWFIDDLSFTGIGMVVPVELTSFSAKQIDNNVELSWITASETNNNGFEVESSTDGSKFEKIGFVQGNGTSTLLNNYRFVDTRNINSTCYYRLKQIDYDGTINLSQVISVNVTNNFDYALEQNYPNPFNPTTNILFSLKEEGQVSIGIFNVLGQKIVDLVNDKLAAGKYNIILDANKYNMTSGVYFVEMNVKNKFNQVKKINLIK